MKKIILIVQGQPPKQDSDFTEFLVDLFFKVSFKEEKEILDLINTKMDKKIEENEVPDYCYLIYEGGKIKISKDLHGDIYAFEILKNKEFVDTLYLFLSNSTLVAYDSLTNRQGSKFFILKKFDQLEEIINQQNV